MSLQWSPMAGIPISLKLTELLTSECPESDLGGVASYSTSKPQTWVESHVHEPKVCGGGPKASLWHLGTRQSTVVFDTQNKGIHVTRIHEDRVLVGNNKSLSQFTFLGDAICNLPSSSPSIYSLILQEKPHRVMCFAGSSPYIDLCTDLNYRDQVLSIRD